MKTLTEAISEFKKQIKDNDYVNLGAKGKYLTVPYRINFVRMFFGERLQIITDSKELANGSHTFKTSVFLDDKLLSTGEAKQLFNKDKEYEKQSTVSVGRALSKLGFMGDEIATAEEMEQFLKQEAPVNLASEQHDNLLEECIAELKKCSKAESNVIFEQNINAVKKRHEEFLTNAEILDVQSFKKFEECEKQLRKQYNERRKK